MNKIMKATISLASMLCVNLAFAQALPPPTCPVGPAKAACEVVGAPFEVYQIPKAYCPKDRGHVCSATLPQGSLSCENNVDDPTTCYALPAGITNSLSYSWYSSNANVIVRPGFYGPNEKFLSCANSTYTTLTVYISDSQGRTTSASAYVRCRPVNPNNP
jgi:hypothetical protein